MLTNRERRFVGVGKIDVGKTEWEPVKGIPVSVDLVDLHRMALRNSPEGKEEIEIDLNESGGPLKALEAQNIIQSDEETKTQNNITSYLTVIPANQLSQIYEKYGDALLESNVRVYMSTTTKINRGIRQTIKDEPNMFFPYNNGISATAESVNFKNGEITHIKNLQIVNGGQTTGTIVSSQYKIGQSDPSPLDGVYVQMKITVIESEAPLLFQNVVQNISRFANTQNTVKASDFFSNHEFHQRMQDISEYTRAKAPGSQIETYWFYERMRGQYNQKKAQARKEGTQSLRIFEERYPKNQLLTKESFARYINIWDGEPVMALGGIGTNFVKFMTVIGKKYETNPNIGQEEFNELYFRESICKSIIFSAVEKIVSDSNLSPWYVPGQGTRAGIVTHTVSKFAYDLRARDEHLDFEQIWDLQGVPDKLIPAFQQGSEIIGQQIVTQEQARQSHVWENIKKLNVDWNWNEFPDLIISSNDRNQKLKNAQTQQKTDDGINSETFVINKREGYWKEFADWVLDASPGLSGNPVIKLLHKANEFRSGGKLPTPPECQKIHSLYREVDATFIIPSALKAEANEDPDLAS